MPIVNGRPGDLGTMTEMVFANGSSITSVPTTEDAGRSEAVSLLVVDEAAIVRYANQIWAAAFPTLSTGGSAIINSCITGETEIIGSNGNFRVDSIAPKEFGKHNVEHLNLKVLTHTGKWQRVIGAVNKGELETWEVESTDGRVLNCTPAHRLLTTKGWRTVRVIIKSKLNIITFDSGLNNVTELTITKPQKKEILKTIKEYPKYKGSYAKKIINELLYEDGIEVSSSYISRIINETRTKTVQISKLKLVRKYVANIYDISVESDESYITNNGVISHNTPYGVGNWYHKSWVDSMTPNSVFNPIRLKWQMHPDRDLNWYNEMSAALGPRRTAQEVDGSFLASGYSVFDLADIKQIEDLLSDFEVLETRYNGGLRIIKRPQQGKKYFIGADIATGRAKDYSAFSIMDRQGDEVAYFKGRVPIEKFIEILNEYGRTYNNALLAPEANDVGIAVVIGLQSLNYPNLYYTEQLVKEKGQSRKIKKKIPGWLTTTANRSLIIDELEQDIRNEFINVKDPFFAEEAYTFIYDSRNKPVAMGKGTNKSDEEDEVTYTDDAILAKAITNFVRKGSMNSMIVLPA